MDISDAETDISMTSARTQLAYNRVSSSTSVQQQEMGDAMSTKVNGDESSRALFRRIVASKVAPVNAAVQQLQKKVDETEKDVVASRSTLVFCGVLLACACVFVIVAACLVFKMPPCELREVDVNAIVDKLRANVFGQHVAVEMLAAALREFFAPTNLNPVLALSFHGWTGVGKNYVSGIITDHLPDAHVTKLIVPLHFPHDGEGDVYAEQVRAWIETNVTRCRVNVVFIDEMDKASEALARGIQQTILDLKAKDFSEEDEAEEEVGGERKPGVMLARVKTLFIFLSNSAGAEINRVTINQVLSGRSREDLTPEIFTSQIMSPPHAFLWYFDMFAKGAVDAVVPFLPLERRHVKLCVQRHLVERGVSSKEVDVGEVMEGFTFFPKSQPVFSKSGCKRVTDLVALAVE